MKNFEKLEVGATYLTRSGDRVTIIEKDDDEPSKGQYHGYIHSLGGTVAYWVEDGRINHAAAGGYEDILDLVEKLGMRDFKIGDRVRITDTGAYYPNQRQGLFVGNAGTVKARYPSGALGLDLDNGAPAMSGDGLWAFFSSELELIDG